MELNSSTNDFMTVAEAAAYLDVSQTKVRTLISTEGWQKKKIGVTRIRKGDVVKYKTLLDINAGSESPWGDVIMIPGESIKPIDFINVINGKVSLSKFIKNDHSLNFKKSKYVISSYGRVFNITQGHLLGKINESLCTNGYPQVNIFGESILVHFLVAYFWCDNGKLKDQVHHIDGDPTNNYYLNLIWVTDAEHAHADRLRRQLEKSGDPQDRKTYDDYIEAIRKDNEQTEQLKMLVIKNKSGFNNYCLLPADLYEKVRSGEVDLQTITSDKIKHAWMDEYQLSKVRINKSKLMMEANSNE